MWKATVGTVTHGTMRPQDLTEVFLSELRDLGRDIPRQFYEDYEDDDPFWEAEEAAEIVDELMDDLNELAPPYVYFGAHPGDGSDYGFWPDWETLETSIVDGELVSVIDPSGLDGLDDACHEAVVINDHGNVGFCQRNGSDWELIWDCV